MPTLSLDFSSSVGFTFDSTKIEFQGGAAKLVSPYSQTKIPIANVTPLLVNAWTNFSTTQNASGTDTVTHSPVINGVRKYWNGSAWATAQAGESNTAAEIAAHCAALFVDSVNAEINLISYLKSGDGTTTPTLTEAVITYDTAIALDEFPDPKDVRAGVLYNNGEQRGTMYSPDDNAEDLDALFEEPFTVAVAWTVSSTDYTAQGLLDEPDLIDGGILMSTEYVLTMKATEASTIRRGQSLTIDGVSYSVRENPRKLSDGKLVRMELSKT